jgi:predicted metal-dependent phosphoesterase TrpH
MALSFSYRDDLVDLGRDEDGSVIVGRSFYVVAEDAAGHRWAHAHSFLDHAERYDAEEGGRYWARRWNNEAQDAVAALLARIEAHVAAGGALDADRWVEVDPVYGSAAYQELDAVGYFAARERHEAREAGEAVPFDQAIDVHFA